MNFTRLIITCGILVLAQTPAWADCNQLAWVIQNNTPFSWSLASTSCRTGNFLSSISPLIHPTSAIAGVAAGSNAMNGVSCELEFFKTHERNINFKVRISQDACISSSGSNQSTVEDQNGVTVGISAGHSGVYEGDVGGGIVFVISR